MSNLATNHNPTISLGVDLSPSKRIQIWYVINSDISDISYGMRKYGTAAQLNQLGFYKRNSPGYSEVP